MPRQRHCLATGVASEIASALANLRGVLVLAVIAITPAGAQERRCITDVSPLDFTLPLHHTRRDSVCVREGFTPLGPVGITGRRSGVADGRGNGAAPAGVGRALQMRAGFEWRRQWLTLRFAPELSSAQNGSFLTFPAGDSTRSGQSSPWYFGDYSADLPSRHGTSPITQFDLGESGVWATGRQWTLGATTALPDWGPGIGEGLVLGRSSAGLPRLEASWRQPLLAGALELRWFGGAAIESRFFDTDPDNNRRGVAGARLSYARPLWRVGLSRTVMDGRTSRAPLAAAALPFGRAGTDSVIEMLSADLRFAHAEAGTMLWMEVARQAPLREFRDLTLMPGEGLAIRLGMSQVLFERNGAKWILGFEAARLEMPPQRVGRVDQDLYTSPTVIHGWTHRGEPLGSGLGPGGQRQLISMDWERGTNALGLFVERVRWNDDALYRQFLPYPVRHDVTLQAGLRGGFEGIGMRFHGTLSGGTRLNYLFQNADFIPGYRTDDARSVEFTLAVSPAGRR
ncbi:MAG: hypothetical protein KF689_05375 [Gemmatimonadaceae bacterium]|nr:hypothetical protein [Gemmatimonadaceae bacterium]MCW5825395.1 hypothetical protein [Gemmatimonadaceae bacterium]